MSDLSQLSDRELVERFLRRQLGFELDEIGGLRGLFRFGVGAMIDELEIDPVDAEELHLAYNIAVRALRGFELEGDPMRSVVDVERWGRGKLGHLDHEQLWVLTLDARNICRAAIKIARGGLHACAVTAADVLRPVIREAASAFVLVHNHPSGDQVPSREDVIFTNKVQRAAETLGITLVDHVVIARDGCSSMLELGLLDMTEDAPAEPATAS